MLLSLLIAASGFNATTLTGGDKVGAVAIKLDGTLPITAYATEEALYVVDGEITITAEGKDWVVGKGGVANLPAYREHTVKGSAQLVQIFVPKGPEQWASKDCGVHCKAAVAPNGLRMRGMSVMKESEAPTYPILAGKGRARMLIEAPAGTRFYLGVLEAEAGAVVPEHKHDDSEEWLYILKGAGETALAVAPTPFSAGTSVAILAGTLHLARFTSAVRALQVYAPGGPEQRFKK